MKNVSLIIIGFKKLLRYEMVDKHYKICILLIVTIMLFTSIYEESNVLAEKVVSPREQTSKGVPPEKVFCVNDKVLIQSIEGKPACVKPESVLGLINSGWADPNTVNSISFSDESIHQLSDGVYSYRFQFCEAIYNDNAFGIIASSDTEKIPVQIDPNIQIDECQEYGTRIHAESESSLKLFLFYEENVTTLIKDFEKKKNELEVELVKEEQKLLRLQDPNLNRANVEEIEKVKNKITWFENVIDSCKDGLKTIRIISIPR